jgi:hypothetical protein
MKSVAFVSVVLGLVLTACLPFGGSLAVSSATPLPQPSLPTIGSTPTPTLVPTNAALQGYPTEGYGPSNFPADIDPLTGLQAADPALLERRPVIIKVSNMPRDVRPQWGLSLADIVYEYYIEYGDTRFAAIYLGNEAAQVGPIRSGRFFDDNLIRMYKGLFAFGSADERIRRRLYNSDYASRLILEWEAGCPAMCRYDPEVHNALLGNTHALSQYADSKNIPNGRQNLDGMTFQAQAPVNGTPVAHVYVRYSAAVYSRWDYDLASGRYLRFADTQNDLKDGQDEAYGQLSDRLTGLPVSADNLVVLLIPHSFYSRSPEIVDMDFNGSGVAYAFRDGQVYTLQWQRSASDLVVYLTYADGTRFAFKPGVTWYEVMGKDTALTQNDQSWRFEMHFP